MSKPTRDDLIRWIMNTGGSRTANPPRHNGVEEAGRAAGRRVFEEVIKGKLKVTPTA